MKLLSLAMAGVLAVIPADGRAQSAVLVGRVISETGEPLAYAVVGIPALSREQFTSDSGIFVLGDLPVGPVALRVRRLGFSPADLSFTVRAGAADTVTVRLSRVTVQLAGITVREYPPCVSPGAPTVEANPTLSAVFTQMRLNAEQYRLLSRSYPFIYTMQIITSRKLKSSGEVLEDPVGSVTVASETRWHYRPGTIVSQRRKVWFFHIPTLPDFADEQFVANHCFHYGGTNELDGRDVIRLDVVAAEKLKDPDVNGSILLDARTFQVRRTELRLSKPIGQKSDVVEFEVATDFKEVMPSIPIISTVWSTQAIDPLAKGDFDMAYEHQHLLSFRFLRAKPGDDPKRPRE